MAKAKVMIDNEKTRVTEWVFDIGDETGQHIHEFDYVVVNYENRVEDVVIEIDRIIEIEKNKRMTESYS